MEKDNKKCDSLDELIEKKTSFKKVHEGSLFRGSEKPLIF